MSCRNLADACTTLSGPGPTQTAEQITGVSEGVFSHVYYTTRVFSNQVNKCKASEFVNTSKNGWRWMSQVELC